MPFGVWLKRKLGFEAHKSSSAPPVMSRSEYYLYMAEHEADPQQRNYYLHMARQEADKQRREAFGPLINDLLAEMKNGSPESKHQAVLKIGRMLARSEGVAPADAIFHSWYHTTEGLIDDIEVMTALGVLAASHDEPAFRVLRDFPIGGDNNRLFKQIEVIAAVPDTGCFEKLLDLMLEKRWYGKHIARALEMQVSSQGTGISSKALRRALAIRQAQWVELYGERDGLSEIAYHDLNLVPLRKAIVNELKRRGEMT